MTGAQLVRINRALEMNLEGERFVGMDWTFVLVEVSNTKSSLRCLSEGVNGKIDRFSEKPPRTNYSFRFLLSRNTSTVALIRRCVSGSSKLPYSSSHKDAAFWIASSIALPPVSIQGARISPISVRSLVISSNLLSKPSAETRGRSASSTSNQCRRTRTVFSLSIVAIARAT